MQCVGKHVCLRLDNTTAVACINKAGSTKRHLLEIVKKIFSWAQENKITLMAAHIPGVLNIDADRESRCTNVDTEWMLKPQIFKELNQTLVTVDIDLFATRINAQLPKYVSWRPDPCAFSIDAFSLLWSDFKAYIFPPFSLIPRILQKLEEDQTQQALVIVPLWPTRVWFGRAMDLLVKMPRLLPKHCLLLPQDPQRRHPLTNRLVLAAMPLSGNRLKIEEFHQRLPILYSSRGDPGLGPNTERICHNGCSFVWNRRMIHFSPL